MLQRDGLLTARVSLSLLTQNWRYDSLIVERWYAMPRKSAPRFDPGRNQWFLRFEKRKYYLCSGKGNWITAHRKATEIMGRSLTQEAPVTISGAVMAYLKHRGNEWHRSRLAIWIRWAGADTLTSIGPDHLEKLLTHLKTMGYRRKLPGVLGKRRDYSPKGLRHILRTVKSVLLWCAAPGRKWISDLPIMPKLDPSEVGHKDVPLANLPDVLTSLRPRVRAIVEFILATGCRPAEACQLKWHEIDWDAKTVRQEWSKTKRSTGDPRIIYLTADALRVLEQRKDNGSTWVFLNSRGKPYAPGGLRSILRRRGIPGCYALRHTFAQAARRAGVKIDVIQKLLGHRNLSTTQIYAKVWDGEAQQAAQNLPPLLPQALAGHEPKPAGETVPGE